jgi:hypothetical protein
MYKTKTIGTDADVYRYMIYVNIYPRMKTERIQSAPVLMSTNFLFVLYLSTLNQQEM